jgi:hypothetical protein
MMYKLDSVWVVVLSTKKEVIDLRAFTNYELAKSYHDSIKEIPNNSILNIEEVIINSSKKYKQLNF